MSSVNAAYGGDRGAVASAGEPPQRGRQQHERRVGDQADAPALAVELVGRRGHCGHQLGHGDREDQCGQQRRGSPLAAHPSIMRPGAAAATQDGAPALVADPVDRGGREAGLARPGRRCRRTPTVGPAERRAAHAGARQQRPLVVGGTPGPASSTTTRPSAATSSPARSSRATGSPPMPTLPSASRAVCHRPSPGSRSKTSRRRADDPARAGLVDGLAHDVDAEHHVALPRQGRGQPARVRSRGRPCGPAAAEQREVGRVGLAAPDVRPAASWGSSPSPTTVHGLPRSARAEDLGERRSRLRQRGPGRSRGDQPARPRRTGVRAPAAPPPRRRRPSSTSRSVRCVADRRGRPPTSAARVSAHGRRRGHRHAGQRRGRAPGRAARAPTSRRPRPGRARRRGRPARPRPREQLGGDAAGCPCRPARPAPGGRGVRVGQPRAEVRAPPAGATVQPVERAPRARRPATAARRGRRRARGGSARRRPPRRRRRSVSSSEAAASSAAARHADLGARAGSSPGPATGALATTSTWSRLMRSTRQKSRAARDGARAPSRRPSTGCRRPAGGRRRRAR